MKPTGTVPELRLEAAMAALGLKFESQCKGLPGTPDFAFEEHRIAVFVHGCYWHRHQGCVNNRTSKSDTIGWLKRHRATVERDQRASMALAAMGWWVVVVWECEIKADAGHSADMVASCLLEREQLKGGRYRRAMA